MKPLVVGLLTVLAGAGALAETRRVAIVVGNNAGTPDLPPLRYAESDAGKMARVLVELGEVDPNDVLLMQGRNVAELERALASTKNKVASLRRGPDTRVVLIFYFSGHSDGEAIEMGPEKLPYPRLRALLTGTGAEVRVAIVDACRSGAGIVQKGGKPAEGFSIRLTDAINASGEAFITSSAADEAALESSEVMGSFFTHNFISGLRGAADTSGDRLVTLGEAYRYAYDRTVSATSSLSAGGQHPNYDYKLSGQGELVLVSLLRPSSTLVLPDGDRALVTDLARDQVVVELPAMAGRDVALAPGQYGVRLFKGGMSLGGRFTLADGARRVVKLDELETVSAGMMVARKGAEVGAVMPAPSPVDGVRLGVAVGGTGRILPSLSSPGEMLKWQLKVMLEPLNSRFASFDLGGSAASLEGQLLVTGLLERTFDPVLGNVSYNEFGGQLKVGYRLVLNVSRVSFGLGAELGGGFLQQLYDGNQTAAVFVGGPMALVRVRLTDTLWLNLDGSLTALAVPIQKGSQVELSWYAWPTLSAGLTLAL